MKIFMKIVKICPKSPRFTVLYKNVRRSTVLKGPYMNLYNSKFLSTKLCPKISFSIVKSLETSLVFTVDINYYTIKFAHLYAAHIHVYKQYDYLIRY